MTAFFNTGLSQQQFLAEYWQKKPFVIRQAFPLPVSELTPDDLASFAGDEDIESRLIQEFGEKPWQLKHGPFDESDFAALPETHWTLLVQDMDKHYPPLQNLDRIPIVMMFFCYRHRGRDAGKSAVNR